VRIKLLIATDDADYAEHLSGSISEHHADVIDVSVCRTTERLQELLMTRRFDAALLEAAVIRGTDLGAINLPLLLWTEGEKSAIEVRELTKFKKYQRISSIVTGVLELCAKASPDVCGPDSQKARISAVWSPAGGVGKTTTALAFAAKMVLEGRKTLYLNLEPFSSVPAYFSESGRSISSVFEMLENSECNVRMLIRGLYRQDSGGIAYFCKPDNYDDMNILSAENIAALTRACAGIADELIIDMFCVCDERTRQVFQLADKVFLVTDQTPAAQTKLSQFTSQHDIFDSIREKTTLVANKGVSVDRHLTDEVVSLPYVQSTDHISVYKTLSTSFGI